MSCREAIFVDKSTNDFPIFLLFFNLKFPIFPIFSILSFLFSYFLSNYAAGHPEKAVAYQEPNVLSHIEEHYKNSTMMRQMHVKKACSSFFFTIFLNIHITSDFHDSSV